MSEQAIQVRLSEQTTRLLRPAQRPVMESLTDYIDNRPANLVRGYLESPAGSGKSVLAARLLADQVAHDQLPHTVIVTPTNILVDQFAQALDEQGLGDTSRRVINWKPDDGSMPILVATYHGFTAHVLNPRSRAIDKSAVRQVIFDEAHHLQGPSVQKAMGVLDHAAFVGLTASPDYDEARQLQNILPDVIHVVGHEEAVRDGLIAPYTTVMLDTGADMSSVPNNAYEYDIGALERALSDPDRNDKIVDFYQAAFPGMRVLVNTATVARATQVADAFGASGVSSAVIHGGLARNTQRKLLADFKADDIKVMAQARLIGEGYDDPELSLVINADPTLSQVRAKQRARAGRIDPKNPDKVMVVVECVDRGYRAIPKFFGDPAVSGAWDCYADSRQASTIEAIHQTIRSASPTAASVGSEAISQQYGKLFAKKRRTGPPPLFEPTDPQCANFPPELFFPQRGGNASAAKRVCGACVDLEPCFDYGVLLPPTEPGIFGGASGAQRRKLRRLMDSGDQAIYEQARAAHLQVTRNLAADYFGSFS